MACKKSILDVMKERPILGDGSYVLLLEKRGYLKAGPWTPEAVLENPDAVTQLHKEYLRAGSDVLQAFTFYATDGKLQMGETSTSYTCEELNKAACDIAKEVALPGGAFVCGGVTPIPTFDCGNGPIEAVKAEFRKQATVLHKNGVDFLLGEFMLDVDETVLAIETMKETGLPVACTMRIGPTGDTKDCSPAECAVRMAKAGADIVGINCQYDPPTCIETMKMMKAGLKEAGLSPFLMIQPNAYWCPETVNEKQGYHELPEFPFAIEPRLITRWDAIRFARDALEIGVRYIGGCCGFESYHIREMAEELKAVRGFQAPGADKYSPFGEALKHTWVEAIRKRHGEEYWMNLVPTTGRPDNLYTAPQPTNN